MNNLPMWVVGYIWALTTLVLIYIMGRELLGGKKAKQAHLAGLFLLWVVTSLAGYQLMNATEHKPPQQSQTSGNVIDVPNLALCRNGYVCWTEDSVRRCECQ